MFSGRATITGNLLFNSVLALLLAIAILDGCSGGAGGKAPESITDAGIGLDFPAGYTYDPATGALYPPSGQTSAVLPSYVTGMTLIISGEGMEEQSYPVNLSTLTVTFTITPGIRTFTIIVTTTLGTFTDSITIDVASGGPLNLGFNLNINAPPSVSGISATPSVAKPGDVISLSCQGSDLDPGDNLTYEWTGPGGWTASGHQAAYTIPNYGSFTFTCTINDGWGGRTSASVTVKAPAPPPPPSTPGNKPPVVSSLTVVDSMTKLTPSYMMPGYQADISCSASDPEGSALTYVLSDQFGVIAASSTAMYVTVPYLGDCVTILEDWIVTCTAKDSKGASGSASTKMPVGWCL